MAVLELWHIVLGDAEDISGLIVSLKESVPWNKWKDLD